MTTDPPSWRRVPRLLRIRLAAALLFTCGLLLAAFGGWWSPWFLDRLASVPGGDWLELILPFLPMAVIGAGAAIYSRS